MGSGGRADKKKVLAVFGSESGSARSGITRVCKKWAADETAGFTVTKILEGNDVKLEEVKDQCDVLLIAVSSYGEGDPPCNFHQFLLQLVRAAKTGEKPLAGMQHCVLGYGASVYETFQNCPRMTDKLLEELGSRRLMQRCELDDASEDDPAVKMKAWETEVFKVLSNLPAANTPSVCKWTVPEDNILEKTEEDLSIDMMSSKPNAGVMFAGAVAVGAAAYYYFNFMG